MRLPPKRTRPSIQKSMVARNSANNSGGLRSGFFAWLRMPLMVSRDQSFWEKFTMNGGSAPFESASTSTVSRVRLPASDRLQHVERAEFTTDPRERLLHFALGRGPGAHHHDALLAVDAHVTLVTNSRSLTTNGIFTWLYSTYSAGLTTRTTCASARCRPTEARGRRRATRAPPSSPARRRCPYPSQPDGSVGQHAAVDLHAVRVLNLFAVVREGVRCEQHQDSEETVDAVAHATAAASGRADARARVASSASVTFFSRVRVDEARTGRRVT
jgi:hypothetical protein